jgi:L-serine dehydratase
MGLEGESPEAVDPVSGSRPGTRRSWRAGPYASWADGLHYQALDAQGCALLEKTCFSVGGGFVVCEGDPQGQPAVHVPYPFASAADLMTLCAQAGIPVSQLMLENEKAWRAEGEIRAGLMRIWKTMEDCVTRGCQRDGRLPGALGVRRRAAQIRRGLIAQGEVSLSDPLNTMDWVNLYAIAVNEENASGGRVVTAPTNGAAGIAPAVLHYFHGFCPQASEERVIRFLLTAAAIAVLYKRNASISGADVGCQGEVGEPSSMAAAGLTEVLGGSIGQVENAAEIAIEHNLGLTCDPVGGLVQIPCIERNAMGAIKAINACHIALRGDGQHVVSLDHVIQTMWQTGQDRKEHY